MVRALQCPNCGTKKRLDGVESETFQCEQCGQVLKVPPAARGGSPPASDGGPPPPRRRSNPVDEAVAAATPARPAPTRANPPPVVVGPTEAAPPRSTAKPPRDALPLAVRIGAWVLAVPIGLAIVGIPARVLGYLTSQKLLDVFVKHTIGRFVPLLVIVVLWALATTILVELFVEGGRWFMLRRRSGHGGAGPAPASPASPSPGPTGAAAAPAPPPPRRQRRSAGARGS